MSPQPPAATRPTRYSRNLRIGVGIGLGVLMVLLVIWLNRHSSIFPRTDPNIGKQTDVVIEGNVTCNGKAVHCGYVIAWQGPPVAYADVRPDGTYRMENAPLGACILTYSIVAPETAQQKETGPLPKDLMPPIPDKDAPPKNIPKEHQKPHDKDPAHAMKKPLDKEALHKKKKGFFGGEVPTAVRMMDLLPEEREMLETAAKKYRDPISKLFEFTTKKGVNSLDLPLLVP